MTLAGCERASGPEIKRAGVSTPRTGSELGKAYAATDCQTRAIERNRVNSNKWIAIDWPLTSGPRILSLAMDYDEGDEIRRQLLQGYPHLMTEAERSARNDAHRRFKGAFRDWHIEQRRRELAGGTSVPRTWPGVDWWPSHCEFMARVARRILADSPDFAGGIVELASPVAGRLRPVNPTRAVSFLRDSPAPYGTVPGQFAHETGSQTIDARELDPRLILPARGHGVCNTDSHDAAKATASELDALQGNEGRMS